MLDPNAPETQEPQTPEPEDDTSPAPLHPAVIVAAEAMCNAALALMRDPDTENINEAIHSLRAAADFIAGDQEPEPTLLQTIGESLEKNMPLLIQAAMQLGANLGERKSPAWTDCFPCGTQAGLTGLRVRQVPLRPSADFGAAMEESMRRGRAYEEMRMNADPGLAETRERYTGLTEPQYQLFKKRVIQAYGPDEALQITGLLYGVGDATDDPPLVP